MSTTLPGNSGWKVSHASDLFGNVVHTRNVDFTKAGYISLARKAIALFTEHSGTSATGDVDFQDVFALVSDGTYLYMFTTDNTFIATISETTFAVNEPTSASAPTFARTGDAVLYNGEVVVSGATAVTTLTGFNGSGASGTWTDKSITLDAGFAHPMAVISNRNELAIANGNVVKTYNTSYSLQNTLTIHSEYKITSMRWRGNKLYIGTRTLNGTKAMLFVWSCTGTTAESGWPVDADWIYSVVEYKSSVAVLTSAGQLLYFNGGGFDELANLPVYYTPYSWTENAGAAGAGKAINRGIWAVGNRIYFTIQGEPRGLFGPGAYDQPGGLWCYEPGVGLHHKAGFNTEPYKILTISSLASNEFNFASAHGVETGDPIYADTVSNIAALTEGYVYYAVKTSTTAFKLASSPADAHAGRFLLCSGTVSGDKLSVDVMDAVGNVTNCDPGPVYGLAYLQPSPFFANEVFFCGSSYDPTHNATSALMSFGMGRNVGHFITPKIKASGVKDLLQKLYANIRNLNVDTDKVVVKYRITDKFGLPSPKVVGTGGRATWVDTTSFTVNTAVKDIRSALVGDEVEISEGAGAGYSAHISAINDNTATWTITIDEAIPLISASDTSDIFINNWKKLEVITNGNRNIADDFAELTIGGVEAWVQFKVEIRGRNIDIDSLKLITKPDKEAQ
jgi:hypothetical protein